MAWDVELMDERENEDRMVKDRVGLTIMFGRGDWWRGEAETWGLGRDGAALCSPLQGELPSDRPPSPGS
jgi:hypothetical protein